jgi:cytochrome c peroxidase
MRHGRRKKLSRGAPGRQNRSVFRLAFDPGKTLGSPRLSLPEGKERNAAGDVVAVVVTGRFKIPGGAALSVLFRFSAARGARVLALVTALAGSGCGGLADDLFCADHDCEFSKPEWRRVEALANLGDPELDASNKYLKNPAAIRLGHLLYFDRDLSGPATWLDVLGNPTPSHRADRGGAMKISCATCHDPAHGGGDLTSRPGHVSIGAGSYDVNGQQTLNAAHYKLLYWNGRADSLWSQAAQVMESTVSMNGNRIAIVRTVAAKYRAACDALFRDKAGNPELLPDLPPTLVDGKPGEPAFDGLPEAERAAINRAYSNISKAIGAYEWELTSRDSDFDRYVNGDRGRLSPAAVRGLKLFTGRAACIDCHSTPLLSDGRFHNIGVPQRGTGVPTESDCPAGSPRCDCATGKIVAGQSCFPWGAFFGLFRLANTPVPNSFRRDSEFSDLEPGAKAELAAQFQAQAVPSAATIGAWRTPSLRDVALTAPYMHDGIYQTLDEVIGHYDRGGTAEASGRKAVELSPLLLSARDRLDLAEFLRTLTGRPTTPELHMPPAGAL